MFLLFNSNTLPNAFGSNAYPERSTFVYSFHSVLIWKLYGHSRSNPNESVLTVSKSIDFVVMEGTRVIKKTTWLKKILGRSIQGIRLGEVSRK